ncbi:MAG: hypothetical protein PHW33_03560 [Candidatus Portnoybacteria bacterium]|nr:hypothetical protein [Candidatus Portnoybacteria bacterium]
MGKVKGAKGGAQQQVPPLAEPVEAEQPKRPEFVQTEAGYIVTNDGKNHVVSGDYQGEKAVWCDSLWGSQTAVFRLTGLEMTKQEAVCVREAWGLNRDAFVLDRAKKPQGVYCIEKMDPSIYKSYLNDEQFKSYRECLKEDQVDKLNELLTIEEPNKVEELVFLGVAFGVIAPLGTMLLNGAWGLLKNKWKNRKDGPKDPPAPPVSGGGGAKLPVLADVPDPVPGGDAKFSALDDPYGFEDQYDPDGVYVPEMKPISLSDVGNQFAEKLGLIAAGIMGAVLMYFAPGAALSMEGAAAGGVFMLTPGSNGGQGGMSGMGPMA